MAKKGESDLELMREVRSRFARCQSWEATARARFVDDIKFCEGDSDNGYQWPEGIKDRMDADQKAMLTINKTKQHCLDIENDARQSKVAIKIRPTGDGASVDSAQVYMGVVRHIEYLSNAGTAYQHGLKFAVRGGWGYWRLVTDYANDDSFDQEVFIRRVKDPLTVYLDPDINEFDGSDANFGFVFIDIPKEEFDRKHPKWKDKAKNTNLGPESWVKEKSVRLAEYFRRVQVSERLLAFEDPQANDGSMRIARESDLEPQLVKALLKDPDTKVRPIKTNRVEWFKIIGDEVAERRDWPGSYIPIIRCVGEETVIDGEMDRKGHTRALKDAQRMFNYNASGSVEYGALQSKTPYMAPADAIEGYETIWDTANLENPSVLPWNHRDDEGNEIPSPTRQQPPSGAPVFMQGMVDAAEWMRMVSGQYQSDMGAPSNERSGAAINARQRQGDNATFHFLDHQAIAIRLTGKMLIDLIPKVYDTTRIISMIGQEDGKETKVKIDPGAQQALQKMAEDRDEVAAIFNPSVGKYEVEADVGPAFATRRQEAWNAYVQILTQNKELVGLIGDLAFKCADFPGAEEIAQRLKRMVPQQALEDGPSPDLLAAHNQIEALKGLVAQVAQKLADKTAEHATDQEKNAILAYDSQTKRLAALKDALMGAPGELIELVKQVIAEAEATSTAGLAPALTPDKEITAEDVTGALQAASAGPQAPAGAPGAPGAAEAVPPGPIAPNDMTAGPAAQPGAVATPNAPAE